MMHTGASQIRRHNLICKTWAPLRVKIFLWLTFCHRHWTGNHRRHHGLEAREYCDRWDQAPETIDHIVVTCPYTREVWNLIYQVFGRQLPQASTSIVGWWRRLRSDCSRCFPERYESKGTHAALEMLR